MAIKREKIQPQGIHVRMVDSQARYTQVVTVSGTGPALVLSVSLVSNGQASLCRSSASSTAVPITG